MRHVSRFGLLISMVWLAAIMFLLVPASPVQATVEPGWPAGTPNTPRSADDVFIDFESGIDGVEIESSIPSVKFTTTSGLNWAYGDIRTGQYNVYPYGGQSYETNGNFFAWLGVTGDVGRIDFVGGGATYCSALVSTHSGLTLDAYNSEGALIASSGWANGNIGTRTFTRLTVDAPAGQTIAYVMVHDTGNYWLIDDLCTDANKAVIPVPGRPIGSHGDKFDIVFVPDSDYGSAADIDTWLPTFLGHINDQIDQRLGAKDPVTGNLDKFNFYYTRMQGTASSHTLPANLALASPWADAYVILHTAEFGDSTIMGRPSIYGAEGPIGRSFIHESGHGIFGLADEYDGVPNGCRTHYFQPDPMPNIWATNASGRADATSQGWDPDDIWKFTECQGDWWKLGTTAYIMEDGTHFANGWGRPASRRIQWFLDQFPAGGSGGGGGGGGGGAWERSLWFDLHVDGGVFSLLDEGLTTDPPPNFLPGQYDFSAKVFSTGGALLGEFGISDPRRILAESDYDGPTWLDSTDFLLILPYFNNGDRVDLIEFATGSVMMSVDISQYASADTTPPMVAVEFPTEGLAVQDGITLEASASDLSGVAAVYFYVREPNGAQGQVVSPEFEHLPATLNSGTGKWEYGFDTLALPDGNYIVLAKGVDTYDNEGWSDCVPFSVRNWAVIELLPASQNNKAGRTMPVKFALRVSALVDPAQPFVWNDALAIKIFATSNPGVILQTSTFGSESRDYRIDNNSLYITNFRTSKVPMQYTVEIWRTSKNFIVGSFTFSTVK